MKKAKKLIFWKIYFWIIFVNGIFTYLWQSFSRLWEIMDLFMFALAIIGLFAFIWNKIVFNRFFWKIYFFVQIIWNIFYLFFLPLPEKIQETFEMSQFSMALGSIIFYIPMFFALYFYAFKKEDIK